MIFSRPELISKKKIISALNRIRTFNYISHDKGTLLSVQGTALSILLPTGKRDSCTDEPVT